MASTKDYKRVVITGATGMIGQALIRECLRQDIHVTALLRKDSARAKNLVDGENLKLVNCEIDGYPKVELPEDRYDAFFHLAWVGSAPKGRNQLQSQVQNIRYALDAVDLAHRLGCKVFVGSGSQAEYGRVEGSLAPDTPTNPDTGYGIAKLAAGRLTRLACQQNGIRHTWARILSIYGPRDGAHTMVMSVIADALAGVRPRCTKGEQMWDYLYCDDCARALLAMAVSGRDGAVYPIGSGQARQMSEYINEICEACGTGVAPDFGAVPYYENQVMYLCADTKSLKSDTGFSPEVGFEEGIRNTIKWYKEQNG